MDVVSPPPTSAAPTATGGPQPRPDAARRTYLLAIFLALAAAATLANLDLSASPSTAWSIPVWAVAALAIAGSLMVFDVEFRSETYTFTFSEIVLVLGLYFASPLALVTGRLSGELLFLTIRERQPARKIVLNLATFFAETVVLIAVQQALMPTLDPRDPIGWLVALVAVVASEVVGYTAVSAVIRWHGGPLSFSKILQIGLVTAPANTSLALVICILLDVEPLAVPLLGGIAVFLLVTYRSYSSLRQRYESLSLLYDFTHLVSGVRQPDEVLDAMLSQAKDLLRAERAEFWLFAGDMCQRHVVDDSGHRTARHAIPTTVEALVRSVQSTRDAHLLARDDAAPITRAALRELDAQDALLAPILEGDDLIGMVLVANRLSEIYSFVGQDAKMFATLASHAGVALQNGRLIKRLHEQARQREHEALHDALTSLPNRVMFASRLDERFERAGEDGEIAIALMDLDGFKEINDTLGHQSGDMVLIEIADRLRRSAGEGVLVARLGGDEFALLAVPGTDRDELDALCRSIRDAIAQPLEIEGIRASMGVSIGLATAPSDGDNAETLIRRADVAMYSAKSGRGGGVCFYDPDRDENTPRRLALAHDLRDGLESGQVRAVFQPKMSLATGEMTGVEALCRWDHPTLGEIMPDEFIPLADRTGISAELTAYMIASALRHAERWQQAGHRWTVAINVSMHALLDDDLVRLVTHLLAGSSVRPDGIVLEITETHVMSDAERTLTVLGELAALGLRLSIDDFGTGYSSLSYLQKLPVHEVKIDKAFVQAMATDRGADAIVRSVLDLARNLDLAVVAEGVEDEDAYHRLRALGCDEAQGYFFARPMAAHEAEAFALRTAGQLAPAIA